MDALPSTPFSYQPLDVSRREIRLLDVQPHGPTPGLEGIDAQETLSDTVLKCRLRHVSLSQDPKPQYETISYCWGEPTRSAVIKIGRHTLKVPLNTELAIRRMAHPDKVKTLWIDAVCINQDDDAERSQQVLQMGDIYSGGNCNLIYLGPDDKGLTPRALANLQSIRGEVTAELGHDKTWKRAILNDRNGWKHSSTPLKTSLDKKALIDLYSCSWFSRLWIFQEAILSPRNTCIRGSSEFDLACIVDLAPLFLTTYADFIPEALWDLPGVRDASGLWELTDVRKSQLAVGQTAIPIEATLAYASHLQCVDAHDKIFGFLGITTCFDESGNLEDVIRNLLRPDYLRSVASVYRDATRACILQRSDLAILTMIRHRDNGDLVSDGYSSWCLRLDRPMDEMLDPALLPFGSLKPKTRSETTQKNRPSALRSLNVLMAPGFVLDTVSACSPVLERKLAAWPRETVTAFFKSCTKLGDGSRRPGLTSALARTLTANVDPLRNPWEDNEALARMEAFNDYHITRGQNLFAFSEVLKDGGTEHRNLQAVRASHFWYCMKLACRNRRSCMTTAGLLALVPKITQAGDLLVIPRPSDNPWVLRPAAGDKFHLVGQCYVDAVRSNELLEEYERDTQVEDRWFEII